ncbi:MAG: heavy-metal-associated domain-containing protein [Sneathiella sp.]|nr:heavy-metal-associated domain-containing protein [Sneathiella sp.]
MKSETLQIGGMQCDGCSERLQKLLLQKDGVSSANVSLTNHSTSLIYDPRVTTRKHLFKIIEKAGFSVIEEN